MKAKSEKTELHQQILENSYMFLEVMDKVSKRLGIERKADIPQAIARAEETLERVYAGDELEHADYSDITELTRDIGKQIWNPKGDIVPLKLAVFGPSDHAIAWKLDNEKAGQLQEMPQPLWKRLLHERSNLLDIESDSLSPYKKMSYEMSLVSVNAGLEALERLGDIELSAAAQVDEKSHTKLPKLNVQFVSEPAMRVWAKCTANLGALPDDPGTIIDALKKVEKGGRADDSLREKVIDDWSKSKPRLPREWIGHATNAIFGSASSSSLDSLNMSSATFCKEVFEEIYEAKEGQSNNLKVDDSAFEQSKDQIVSTLESIDETLKEMKSSGSQLPASILKKLDQEADNLRELAEAAQNDQADIDDSYTPGLN